MNLRPTRDAAGIHLRVLWVGDAACSSGFARVTHAVCDELFAAGHDVAVVGINYYGDPHGHPYSIYPPRQPFDGGRDGYGVTRTPAISYRFKPDVIVLLNDPWNVEPYLDALRGFRERSAERGFLVPEVPVVAFMAVDAKNQFSAPALNRCAHVATWTRFGADELKAGGYEGEPSVVPLGVDSEKFYPGDRSEAREKLGLEPDAFYVGVVGRNQPRKRLDLTLEAFADWVRNNDVPNARLLLHVAPTGDRGFDLKPLVRHFGLERGRVLLSTPNTGAGAPDEQLRLFYSAFDCYLTTTQGEGWGLPCLEAMACGTPCLVPDHSGLGDWTGSAAVKVPCSAIAVNAPIGDLAYTVGGVVDRRAVVSELNTMYRSSAHRDTYRRRGLKLAASLPWSRTGCEMREVIEAVALQFAPGQEAKEEGLASAPSADREEAAVA
jgi:glycosyltransferase involved in cell wall biosynthesis